MSYRRRSAGLLVVLATALVLAAPAAAQVPAATTLAATDVTSDAATLNGSFDTGVLPPPLGFSYAFEWGPTDAYGASVVAEPGVTLGTVVPVSAAVGGLPPGAVQHYRLVVTDTATTDAYRGEDLTFTTLAAPPVATTLAATDVTPTSARLHATVDPRGDVTAVRFEIEGRPPTTTTQTVSAAGDVSDTVTGLAPGTGYRYRVVARNDAGETLGEWVAFTTDASQPAATALAPRNVTRTTATLRGVVNPHGADTVVHFEVSGGPVTDDVAVGAGTSAVRLAVDVGGLTPETQYAYTVVATNAKGTTRSTPFRFTTAVVPLPVAATGTATDVTATGATLSGSVGPPEVATEYRFEVRRAGAPAVVTVAPGDTPATAPSVTATATGLEAGTPYEFRVVATNQSGATRGAWVPFTTRPAAPAATTDAARDVTPTTAVLQATVNPHGAETTVAFEIDGGAQTTAASAGAGTAPATVERPLDGLAPSTTYRFRVVATNAEGTTRGAFAEFTTAPAPAPAGGAFEVVTGEATDAVGTTARVFGTVGARPFAVGYAFAYGVTTAYGQRTAIRQAEGADGAVVVGDTLTALLPGTTYHYQLVGADGGGTQAFGGDRTFTTAIPTPPAPVAPRRVSASLRPGRDRLRPFRYRVTGRLALPSALAGSPSACSGRVRVTVRQGPRVRGSSTVPVRSSCRYAAGVTARRVTGRRGTLKVTVRFLGNARLKASSAPARVVRFG